MIIERSKRDKGHVNLTPLIDIIFLLIVFFMLTSKFIVTESLDLSFIPIGQNQEKPKEEPVVVKIMDNQLVSLNNKEFELSRLSSKILPIISKSPDRDIIIISQNNVSVQTIVTTLDSIHIAGGRNVSISKE